MNQTDKAAHTPGPWVASTKANASGGVEHAQGFVAFTAIPRQCSDERQAGESWLDMRQRTQPERDAIEAEQIANARLIAAAPELLEALIAAERQMRAVMHPDCADDVDSPLFKARAAIAKATGAAS